MRESAAGDPDVADCGGLLAFGQGARGVPTLQQRLGVPVEKQSVLGVRADGFAQMRERFVQSSRQAKVPAQADLEPVRVRIQLERLSALDQSLIPLSREDQKVPEPPVRVRVV